MSAYLLRLVSDATDERFMPSAGAASARGTQAVERHWQWLTIGARTTLSSLPTAPLPCINVCGNAHSDREVLGKAARFCASLGTPSFNAPESVLGSVPECLPKRLASIPGICVPRTAFIRTDYQDELLRLVAAHELRYPVLAQVFDGCRPRGQVRIDSPTDCSALYRCPWPGRAVYLTEIAREGAHSGDQRLALTVVGDEVAVSPVTMTTREAACPVLPPRLSFGFESHPADVFDGPAPKHVREHALAIATALALDYFVMEASLLPDGELLVDPFLMRVATVVVEPSESHLSVAERQVQRRVGQLLRRPHRWRAPHGSRQLRATRA